MIQKILLSLSFMATIFVMCLVVSKQSQSLIERMPIITDDPYAHLAKGGVPIEQRESRFRKWLAAGVKISVTGASGSGTIIYYDDRDGYAYVQSCGHLWNGVMSAEQAKQYRMTCKIITWYHNETKLNKPESYTAEVLYYSNSRGRDCSLLRFKPEWIPDYFPIAPEGFQFNRNDKFHSVGCDSGSEVAHYEVEFLGMRGDDWPDAITTNNSPRPGRSGGGLMNESYYIGICWGTTDTDGTGNGLFTPLRTIRAYNKMNGYGWLNDVGFSLARQLPIRDRNNPQGKYPKDYIPLPSRN